MTPRKRRLEPIIGDLHEQRANGRSRTWYWMQVVGVVVSAGIHSDRARVAMAGAALVLSLLLGRFAFPLLLGVAFTSFSLWRFHRTSLVLLYIVAVTLLLPDWMIREQMMPTTGDRVFWSIAQVLAGYGMVGVLLVPFLILRLGRSGPLAEPPISLSLGR